MNEKHPQVSNIFFFFKDQQNNTKNLYAKYHEKTLSYLQHGETPKMGFKIPKIGPKENQRAKTEESTPKYIQNTPSFHIL